MRQITGARVPVLRVLKPNSICSATSRPIPILIAHWHLGLGRVFERRGTREQAQEHVATATTMYREMDMPYWLEQAELKECT